MQMKEFFLAELEREAPRSRRTLEQMPDAKADWQPHDRSMAFGYLAELVATMPRWIVYTLERDELDIAPKAGGGIKREPLHSREAYLAAHERAVNEARESLQKASEDYLLTHWRLLAGGHVVSDTPRHIVIRETFNHLAHHRGQMTVYLRLLGAKVPAIYGPSADDKSFG
jgi:uncharacterized damage-inducible protein DinB